jgi:DegV family protein with EDD domain
MSVAIVTDSTACLPPGVAEERGITVVPLMVLASGREGREGVDVSPADVATALRERRAPVTTSRPTPAEFEKVYRRLLDGGADGVVSIHLSAKLSGTVEAAEVAATAVGDRVAVVDAASSGMAVGFPVLVAASAAAVGADLSAVRASASAAATRTRTLFYVDTLEFLRRGGRIGAASALLATALSVKPILHVVAGEVVPLERVRTAGRALARLVDIVVEEAGESEVDVAVHHLDALPRAEALLTSIRERLGARLCDGYLSEVGAAVGAHLGPGFAGVVLHRRT